MKGFTKTVEDFNCAHCGAVVSGNGYTNHCPNCLWSRHVDNNPGDRAATCGGMMAPVAVESSGDKFIITHRCEICGKEKRQKTTDNDNIDTIIEISRNKSFIFGK
ncbi:MAG: RNHCP domain-containing protein [Alphaproteobacteria bacterium]|nr:RNHCP domain-containing protein [Alphaproteobacteria bacterium]